MVNWSDEALKIELAIRKEALERVKRGEVWDTDHPTHYTPEERNAEIARIRARIAGIAATLAISAALFSRSTRSPIAAGGAVSDGSGRVKWARGRPRSRADTRDI